MRILIVDDAKINLMYGKDIIESSDIECEIFLCDNGKKALTIIEQEKIDILLLDIVMPEITGMDVLKILKKQIKNQNIMVIMFTSLTDKSYLKKSFEYGALDFVNKPIEPIEFIARIKSAIRLKTVMDELHENNKKLEQNNKQLKETQFQLVQKEKLSAIGQLAAGVAHEINNPMGYISSNFETLAKYIKAFKQLVNQYKQIIASMDANEEISLIEQWTKEHKIPFIMDDIDDLLKESRQGIEKVSKIVLSLRNFARAEVEDIFTREDLNEIIGETLLIVKNEAKYTIDIETISGELVPVLCNRGQISQILLNILLNAIQAIKKQESETRGKIQVETYMLKNNVVCKITDDGPGIPEDIMEKIFDPFFTTKDVGEGTGLGLSISYDIIVNKHKGAIFVDSTVGQGTTFTIQLPINHSNIIGGNNE